MHSPEHRRIPQQNSHSQPTIVPLSFGNNINHTNRALTEDDDPFYVPPQAPAQRTLPSPEAARIELNELYAQAAATNALLQPRRQRRNPTLVGREYQQVRSIILTVLICMVLIFK